MVAAPSVAAASGPMTHAGSTAHGSAFLVKHFLLLIRQQSADLIPVREAFLLNVCADLGQLIDLGLEPFLISLLHHQLAELQPLRFHIRLEEKKCLLVLDLERLDFSGLLGCQVGDAARFLTGPRTVFLGRQREGKDKRQPD
jgi:hypothetical protein